jgi:hypothetical protein
LIFLIHIYHPSLFCDFVLHITRQFNIIFQSTFLSFNRTLSLKFRDYIFECMFPFPTLYLPNLTQKFLIFLLRAVTHRVTANLTFHKPKFRICIYRGIVTSADLLLQQLLMVVLFIEALSGCWRASFGNKTTGWYRSSDFGRTVLKTPGNEPPILVESYWERKTKVIGENPSNCEFVLQKSHVSLPGIALWS